MKRINKYNGDYACGLVHDWTGSNTHLGNRICETHLPPPPAQRARQGFILIFAPVHSRHSADHAGSIYKVYCNTFYRSAYKIHHPFSCKLVEQRTKTKSMYRVNNTEKLLRSFYS